MTLYLFLFLAIILISFFLFVSSYTKPVLILLLNIFIYMVFARYWILLVLLNSILVYLISQKVFKNNLLLIIGFLISLVPLAVKTYFLYISSPFQLGELTTEGLQGKNLILPIGLTFQALQSVIYIIYVYRGKFVQEKKVIDFLNVTTFFPMLLNILLLPYHSVSDIFKKKREFNYQLALDGVSLIFFGLFKKIVVSQRMATLYVGIFHTHYTRSFSLLLIAIAPIFIFIEYSSYIDILRGLCKVFNYDVPEVYNISYTGMSFTTILKETHKGFYQWLKENIYLPLLSFGTSKLDIILWRFIVVFFASVLIFHSLGIQLSFFIFLFLQIDKVLCKIEIRSIRILKNTAMWFLGWIFLIFISLVFLKGSLPQGLILIRNLSFKSMAGFPPHNFVSLGTDTTIALICSVIIMALELSKSRTSRMFKQAPSFIQWGLNCFLLIFVSFFYFGNGIIFLFCSI